jgi:hypothetical protein
MPNTPVRAAAEGMPSINRRRAMLGAGATAAALAVTSLPAEPSSHPDEALFALEREFDAAARVKELAVRVCTKAEKKAAKASGPRPIMPHDWEVIKTKMPDDIAALHSAALQNIRFGDALDMKWHPEPVRAYYAARSEERAKVKAAWEEWDAKWRAALKQFDCERLEEEYEARLDELHAIGGRIFETPAKTIEGVAVKLRAGDALGLQDFTDDVVLDSVAADIKRLAGAVS